MKKILFIINVDWFFVSHRLPIALEAIKQGYEVHLACCFTDKKSELVELGIHVHDIDFSRSGSGLNNELKTLWKIRSVIKNVQPDIVHAITIKPVIYVGLIIRTLTKKPAFVAAISGLGYVFSVHTYRAKLIKLLVSKLYRFALSHKNKIIIFQNDSDERILTKVAKIVPTQKKLIKGSGADLDFYTFTKEASASTIKVVMASRLLKEKGVYEFVNAAKLLRKKNVPAEFILVGSPDGENPNSVLKREVDHWHKTGVIKALGHRYDIDKIFVNCHIVVLPSYYGEGVPKVLIEAAACGRPIVTTDNPGCRDAVIPFETGLLVPVKNSQALAEAILKLITHKQMREEMGLSARKLAEQEFDIKSVIKKHLSIYTALLNEINIRR